MISIIVPVYGVEAYLSRCLDSLTAQTIPDWEAILVDDGSPDRSGAICDAYAAADPRFRVIHRENGGLSAARNTGLAAAAGEWILFLDSDDWIHPRTLELLLSAATQMGADMAMCDFVHAEAWSEPAEQGAPTVLEMSGRDALLSLYRKVGARFVVAWGKLWRRERLTELCFPEGRIHEDEATTYRLLYPLERLALVEAPLWYYYRNPESITRIAYSEKRLDLLTALEEEIDFFSQNGDGECLDVVLRRYWQAAADLCQLIRENAPSDEGADRIALRVKAFCKARALRISASTTLLLEGDTDSPWKLRRARAKDLLREKGLFGCISYYWKKL